MKKPQCFENYPLWIVLLSNLFSLAIYIAGSVIIYNLGLVWLILYIIYILILEFKLMKFHCINCYYYGKTCAFGRSRISSIFFKKGSPKMFCNMNISWKDILPDFMVSIIPFVTGIILLIKNFNLVILSLVILLFILASAGNSFIRGSLACRFCRQKNIGCPAQKLFDKKKK